MNKKPRTDKRKNVGKVAESLVKNPNKTEREIAKETGLGKGTVNRAKRELEKTGAKDKTIAYIVDSARNRIKKVSGIFDRYISESEQKDQLNAKDITTIKDIVKDDLARITVLGGQITDDKGGLKEFDFGNKTIKELEEWRQSLLG